MGEIGGGVLLGMGRDGDDFINHERRLLVWLWFRCCKLWNPRVLQCMRHHVAPQNQATISATTISIQGHDVLFYRQIETRVIDDGCPHGV